MFLLAAVPASAQTTLPARMFDVPAEGYSGTDTYNNTDMWNEYRVNVPRNHELEYEFHITGQGNFTVYLIPHIGAEYLLQGSYYISYSSPELVDSFARVFPADPGYEHEYTIVVNSTANVTYTASISINEVDIPDYTIYYILIILGGIGLVVVSWQLVKLQMRREREAKITARKNKENRRARGGKRRH